MNRYYIYSYSEFENDLPFYIGKGTGNRKNSHLLPCKYLTINTHFYHKLRKILDSGLFPIIKILYQNLENIEAKRLERELILKYGRLDLGTGCLTNHTSGGDGCQDISDETRFKMQNAQKGKIIPSHVREAARKSLFGGVLTPEHKNKIATSHLGLSCSHETKTKISISRIARGVEIVEKARQGQIKKYGRCICSLCPVNLTIVKIFDCLNSIKKLKYSTSLVTKALNTYKKVAYGYYWLDYEVSMGLVGDKISW